MLEKAMLAGAGEQSDNTDERTSRHPPTIDWIASSEAIALDTLKSHVGGLLVFTGSVHPFRPRLSGLATDSPLSIPQSAAGGPISESKTARMH
jgi:hypothetical protein